jgi:acyl carrier protein
VSHQSSAEIQDWIVSFLAKELKVSRDRIPVDEQLTNIGLSSRQAVMLTGDLEDYLGRPVDPAVVWDHPTIRKLSEHLARAE